MLTVAQHHKDIGIATWINYVTIKSYHEWSISHSGSYIYIHTCGTKEIGYILTLKFNNIENTGLYGDQTSGVAEHLIAVLVVCAFLL